MEGWEEEVYRGGKLVGTFTRYSDRLLVMLLRSRRPEVYGNRAEVKSQAAPTPGLIDPTTSTDAELMERIEAARRQLLLHMGRGVDTSPDGAGVAGQFAYRVRDATRP